MTKIKNIILFLALSLGILSTAVFAQEEPELEVSFEKSAVIVNTENHVEIDASAYFTSAGYHTPGNSTAINAGLAIGWTGRGYIDVDLECEANISRIVWTKNHVYGSLGLLKAYGANSPDFSDKVFLGDVNSGTGAFTDEGYYRYIRLEKTTNFDFYPGKISVYGYKIPFVFNGMNNVAVNPDSVVELEFSENLSDEINTESIQLKKNGAVAEAEITVSQNKILISVPSGFVPGGIYEITIPGETIVAEDTRTFNEEIKKYFAVNTDKTEILQYSLENGSLSFNIRNKTESALDITVWSVGFENFVSGAVTESTYTVAAGETTGEQSIPVAENFAVYMFEDSLNLKQLLTCFSNLPEVTHGEEIPAETAARYVDGSVLVSGSCQSDEITAVIIAENTAVSASGIKAVSTAAVKNGKFFIEMKLPNNMQSGNYVVWLSDGKADTPEKLNVYVLGEEDKQKYAGKIADMSAEELKVFFETDANEKILSGIGVIADRPQNLTALYTAIENVELKGTYSEIANGINTQIILALTKEKGAVYGISNFNDCLGVDETEELYVYVSENSLFSKAQEFMKNEFTDVSGFKTELYNSFKLAVFTNAPSAEYASEFAKTNNDFFAFNFDGNYASLSAVNKRNVISRAMKGTSLEDIRVKFDQAVAEYKKKETTPSRPTTGGGGGGGGGGASAPKLNVDLPEIKVDELKETEEEIPEKTPESIAFSDMPESHWAYKSVSELAQKGIVSGFENKFNPDNNVTREEFVKMLTEAAEIENTGMSDFSDVPAEAWYYPYVSRALNSGIVRGITDTHFGTGHNITRQDMAVMIYNTLVLCKAETENVNTQTVFADYEYISDYAKEAVEALSGMNLINGRENNNFAPQDNATRAEAAELICRMLECIG